MIARSVNAFVEHSGGLRRRRRAAKGQHRDPQRPGCLGRRRRAGPTVGRSINCLSLRPDIGKERHLEAAASIGSKIVMTLRNVDAFVEHNSGLRRG